MQNSGFVVMFTDNGTTKFSGPHSEYGKALAIYENLVDIGAKDVRIAQLVTSPYNPKLR